jgi:hypothetical protein
MTDYQVKTERICNNIKPDVAEAIAKLVAAPDLTRKLTLICDWHRQEFILHLEHLVTDEHGKPILESVDHR